MFDLATITRAASVADAVRLLSDNPKARLIAGGTDVLIKLRHGDQAFAQLVDIHGLEELNYIRLDGENNLLIGSGVTFTRLSESPIIETRIPLLREAALSVGGPQVRNIATIGGNVCNGVPSADSAPGLFVLDALVMIQGREGFREQAISDFYKGPGKVALTQGDVVLGFRIRPESHDGFAGHYYKYAMRNAMDIATIGCGVSLKTANSTIADFRICFSVAGPMPIRCPGAEELARGSKISQGLVEAIAEKVMADVKPRTSWRATEAFRRQIIRELSRRVTLQALKRAGEEVS